MRYRFNKAMSDFCYWISDKMDTNPTYRDDAEGWVEAGNYFMSRAIFHNRGKSKANHPSNTNS